VQPAGEGGRVRDVAGAFAVADQGEQAWVADGLRHESFVPPKRREQTDA
jgi:hypothetical protein